MPSKKKAKKSLEITLPSPGKILGIVILLAAVVGVPWKFFTMIDNYKQELKAQLTPIAVTEELDKKVCAKDAELEEGIQKVGDEVAGLSLKMQLNIIEQAIERIQIRWNCFTDEACKKAMAAKSMDALEQYNDLLKRRRNIYKKLGPVEGR